MLDTLTGLGFLLQIVLPAIALVAGVLQLKVIGRRPASLILILSAIVWGGIYTMNPFHVMWLPNRLYDPNRYAVFRGALVLIFVALVAISLLRRSFGLQIASICLLALIAMDVLWSHIDGRYAGP